MTKIFPAGLRLNFENVMHLTEVFKVAQRDQIVGHNVSDSPEQCSGEQTLLS